MKLKVSRWGNSLAVRLPAECTRATGLREGDSVEAQITATGQITLSPVKLFDRLAFLARLRKLRTGMPMQTEDAGAFVRKMRNEDRY